MANKELKTFTMGGTSFDVPSGGVTGVKGEQESVYRDGDVNLDIADIAFLGLNPTGGVANDTVAFWKNLGVGYAQISQANQVAGQPATYGWILNFPVTAGASKVIAQYFLVTSNGLLYRRGNNASATTAMPEFVPVNTDTTYTASDANPLMDGTATPGTSAKYAREGHRHPTDTTRAPLASPTFTGEPKAPSISDKSESSTQIANTAFVQGAINRRLPKTTTSFRANTTAIATANNTVKSWTAWTATAAGTIIATGCVTFAPNATGRRSFEIKINGSGIGLGTQVAASPNGNTLLSGTLIRHLNEGDKVEFHVIQQSGGALNVTSDYLMGIWIRD